MFLRFQASFTANLLLSNEAAVEWSVYHAAESRVAHSPSQTLAAGNYLLRQNADTWSPGLYILQVDLNGERLQRKLWKGR